MIIKTFEKFSSGFTFDDILQELKDEFTTQFYFCLGRMDDKKFNGLDEWHSHHDGKYSSLTGLYYCLYVRIQNREQYKETYPILLEIIDRMSEKHLYPQNCYFELPRPTDRLAGPCRKFWKLPEPLYPPSNLDPGNSGIPYEFTGFRMYFSNIKSHPKTLYQRIRRLAKYQDLDHGSLED